MARYLSCPDTATFDSSSQSFTSACVDAGGVTQWELLQPPSFLPPLSASDGIAIAVAISALWATAFVWKLLQRVF